MAEISEFCEISTEFIFRLFLKILLNIFKLLFPKFSNFGGGRNQRISRNFAEILNTASDSSDDDEESDEVRFVMDSMAGNTEVPDSQECTGQLIRGVNWAPDSDDGEWRRTPKHMDGAL